MYTARDWTRQPVTSFVISLTAVWAAFHLTSQSQTHLHVGDNTSHYITNVWVSHYATNFWRTSVTDTDNCQPNNICRELGWVVSHRKFMRHFWYGWSYWIIVVLFRMTNSVFLPTFRSENCECSTLLRDSKLDFTLPYYQHYGGKSKWLFNRTVKRTVYKLELSSMKQNCKCLARHDTAPLLATETNQS